VIGSAWWHALAAVLTAMSAFVTAVEARPRRVLVVTETAGFHHDSIPDAVALVRRIARRDGRYTVRLLGAARELTARLRHADAVMFLNTSGELPLTADEKGRLLAFVRAGGGFIGTHSASDTFHTWPDYLSLLGAEFEQHPFGGEGRVIVEDGRHPATRRLPQSFVLREEFYFFKANPRCCAHVLARLDVGSFGGDPAEDRPLVWCRREGRGRVFYDALGHFPATWRERHQRTLLAGGLAWVLRLARSAACR
jgi:hypothetical protein